MPYTRAILAAATCLALSACGPAPDWNGKWTGPEGTYLSIAPGHDDYKIAIRNLDGERVFDGKRQGKNIVFTRDGVTETIHTGDGDATGMKWLAGKKNCLIVKTGEGYCRD